MPVIRSRDDAIRALQAAIRDPRRLLSKHDPPHFFHLSKVQRRTLAHSLRHIGPLDAARVSGLTWVGVRYSSYRPDSRAAIAEAQRQHDRAMVAAIAARSVD